MRTLVLLLLVVSFWVLGGVMVYGSITFTTQFQGDNRALIAGSVSIPAMLIVVLGTKIIYERYEKERTKESVRKRYPRL
jgi:hypothetical protein